MTSHMLYTPTSAADVGHGPFIVNRSSLSYASSHPSSYHATVVTCCRLGAWRHAYRNSFLDRHQAYVGDTTVQGAPLCAESQLRPRLVSQPCPSCTFAIRQGMTTPTTSAVESVTSELSRLEENAERAIQAVNQSFDALQSLINKRKQEVLSSLEIIQQQKKKAFNEQLQLIEAEKGRVERDCEGMLLISQ